MGDRPVTRKVDRSQRASSNMGCVTTNLAARMGGELMARKPPTADGSIMAAGSKAPRRHSGWLALTASFGRGDSTVILPELPSLALHATAALPRRPKSAARRSGPPYMGDFRGVAPICGGFEGKFVDKVGARAYCIVHASPVHASAKRRTRIIGLAHEARCSFEPSPRMPSPPGTPSAPT